MGAFGVGGDRYQVDSRESDASAYVSGYTLPGNIHADEVRWSWLQVAYYRALIRVFSVDCVEAAAEVAHAVGFVELLSLDRAIFTAY